MCRYRLFLGLVAALTFSAIASPASAGTINASPAGAISLASPGTLTITASGTNITCSFTLRGTLAASIVLPSDTDATIGSLTSVSVGGCSGGVTRAFLGFPWTWKVRYHLNGPSDITFTFTIQTMQFLLNGGIFNNCLYQLNKTSVARITTNPGTIGSRTSSSQTATLVSGLLCPTPLTISGGITLSPGQSFSVAL